MAKLCNCFCFFPMGVTQPEQKLKAPLEIIIVPLWLARCLFIPLFKQMLWQLSKLVLDEQYARVRCERVFRDRRDLLMESDAWLISRFRLPRHVLIDLCNNFDARLKRETRRSNALPVPVQVLATLGFLATVTFQREIGDRAGVSQPTISRTMPEVLAAIKSLSRKYIRFPYNDAQQSVIKRQFYEIAGFPNVVGAIACTHVHLKAPSMNDYASTAKTTTR